MRSRFSIVIVTSLPSFNDDIQGTGAVASACIVAGDNAAGRPLADSRVLIYGAGAAGLGIARQIKSQLATGGVPDDVVEKSVLVMDSRGVVSADRENLDSYKQELAWSETNVAELGLGSDDLKFTCNSGWRIQTHGDSRCVGPGAVV